MVSAIVVALRLVRGLWVWLLWPISLGLMGLRRPGIARCAALVMMVYLLFNDWTARVSA